MRSLDILKLGLNGANQGAGTPAGATNIVSSDNINNQ